MFETQTRPATQVGSPTRGQAKDAKPMDQLDRKPLKPTEPFWKSTQPPRPIDSSPAYQESEPQSGSRSSDADLRTLIIEIAPPTLRREGLHAALLEILHTLKSGGTKTRLELPSNLRLRPDRASLVFRVAQEVLRNVVAHAEAKHVTVALKEADGMAILKIMDDGKGFSEDQVARRRAQGHVGTSAIVELAEDAGGTLDIQSEVGKGTRVTLSVPAE